MSFLFLGLLIGALGTLIGAGGGFILVPILLFLFPAMPPALLTAISMLVVLANAGSGSIAYALSGKVHFRTALVFIICSFPGVYFGVQATESASKSTFNIIFGMVILLISIFIFWRSTRRKLDDHPHEKFQATMKTYTVGGVLSAFVGFSASFLGIGGGVIHVPLLAEVLGYPVHLAAGTSHMILAVTALFAVAQHAQAGHYSDLQSYVIFIAVGALVGAQLGARLSAKVSSKVILRTLCVALFLVGIRLIIHGLRS